MSVCRVGSMNMCVAQCVCCVDKSPISHVKQSAGSFYLRNAVENIIVFAEHCKDPH